ncbi:MAG TPA: hypothetical protein VE998_04480, partial [Terriglobales bacterium]|nr:hypothetical protein [Terriglobales bacterium]
MPSLDPRHDTAFLDSQWAAQAGASGSAMNDAAETSPESATRILVVRLGSLGDIVHTLPAVALLRAALPHAHIGWVVEERWAELLAA